MKTLWLDYETRSNIDLLKTGAYVYAADPSTRVLIASYAFDNGPVKRWQPWENTAYLTAPKGRIPVIPVDLLAAFRNPHITIRAHNASFERLITKYCLAFDLPPSRWYCTAYQARSAGCPGKLDDVARMVNPEHRKDQRGGDLIRRYSCPPFENDAIGLTQFGVYCDQDTTGMRGISLAIPELTDMQRNVWAANEIINDRGLPIDVELCKLATGYIERELATVEARMVNLTGTKARGQGLTQWIYEHLADDQQFLMQRGDSLTLDKATREELLALDLPPGVEEALTLMDMASLSSTAKFQQMLNRTSKDGRLRGAFVAAGAAATGRYASWGAQIHNFPRMSAKDPEAVKKRMRKGADLAPNELKSMLRPTICAGHTKSIVRCDWNAIEARGLPWLAGKPAERYLSVFNDKARDIYVEQAIAAGLGEMRQEGKVVVLSLGYGGAEGALTKMARAYGVEIPGMGRVVRNWRSSNSWAPAWWKQLMDCARGSIRKRGDTVAGRVEFVGPGMMQLPSGRIIYYPGLSFDESGEMVYLKAAKKPKKGEPWPLARMWHGILAENATQAVCCDLLRELTVREADSPLIGHVHDECIAECTNQKEGMRWLENAMLTKPKWAKDFPLAAKAEAGKRFGK